MSNARRRRSKKKLYPLAVEESWSPVRFLPPKIHPSRSEIFLVYQFYSRNYAIAYYDYDKEGWYNLGKEVGDVTHYCKLQEPPKIN